MAPSDAARPVLQSDGSFLGDGVDDSVVFDFEGGAGPADCEIAFYADGVFTRLLNQNLSGNSSLDLFTYGDEIGPKFILYDNANGPLTDAQRADIQAYVTEGLV